MTAPVIMVHFTPPGTRRRPTILQRLQKGIAPGTSAKLNNGHEISIDGKHFVLIDQGGWYTYFELRMMIDGAKP
jgi:hypothetical protein